MSDITPLNSLLNWRLLTGSHEWPGPDGGTCINEAAIVAAGFRYRNISGAEDLPPCFSRLLGGVLIDINDSLGDGDRQLLIRYVTRLAGSRDRVRVEIRRCQYLLKAFGVHPHDTQFHINEATTRASRVHRRKVRRTIIERALVETVTNVLHSFEGPLCNMALVLKALDGAFAIGKQSPEVDVGLINMRMEQIRAHQQVEVLPEVVA